MHVSIITRTFNQVKLLREMLHKQRNFENIKDVKVLPTYNLQGTVPVATVDSVH